MNASGLLSKGACRLLLLVMVESLVVLVVAAVVVIVVVSVLERVLMFVIMRVINKTFFESTTSELHTSEQNSSET